jgi:hypothetical protein
MKNIVRCLAIALAVTGFVATTSANGSTKTTVTATKTSAYPTPTCEPGSGDCGLGGW